MASLNFLRGNKMNEHIFLLFPSEGEAKEQFKEYFKKAENYLKSLGFKNIINPVKVEKALPKGLNQCFCATSQ